MSKNDEDKQVVLETLKFELQLLESGIYNPSVTTPHIQPQVLIDSLTCLNYQDQTRSIPCDECKLIQFVPENKTKHYNPCHHIPLNDSGDTIESFMKLGDQSKLIKTVRTWYKTQIAKLEQESIVEK